MSRKHFSKLFWEVQNFYTLFFSNQFKELFQMNAKNYLGKTLWFAEEGGGL